MSRTDVVPEQVSAAERFAAAFAYVLGAVPALVNLDPYLNLIGPVVPAGFAETANLVVLVSIIGLWFGFQATERGFTRSHVAQMGVAGWLAPAPQLLGTGLVPLLAAIVVFLGMLVLGGIAWAGVPPSLPLIGRLSRRWGRYDRRENT
ncbi:MAG: hypothetical protein O2822_06555 [Chloroflexi bacterium]|nr:hypothetical protein [Chloroflexota bacterium]